MTTIRVPRPEDPELRAEWDEARDAVEARQQHPARMRARALIMERLLAGVPEDATPTPSTVDPDCCVGDRSQCRCAAKQLAMTDEDVDREKWAAVWRDEVEP